ncbi:MAG: NAD(P)H-binding protein [Pseudomonadota bacterium]
MTSRVPLSVEVSSKQAAPSTLKILILGGAGFIGRHAVAAAQAAGLQVVIGSRHPERHEALHPGTAWSAVRFERLLNPGDWALLLEGVDVVLNCVGILRQRPDESYEHIHHRAPAALAAACASANIRLIHTSALGLHKGAKSRFLSSKLLGEQAIAASGCDYSIVRPSLLDGEGGFGASWLRGLSRSPLHFIPRSARGGIAAMRCSDLGEAFAVLARLPTLVGHREVELGGIHSYGYAEYLRELRKGYTTSNALQLSLPDWLARLGAHVCDGLHFSPFSYGHWILLQRDNVPSFNHLPDLLGRVPHPISSTPVQATGLPAKSSHPSPVQ